MFFQMKQKCKISRLNWATLLVTTNVVFKMSASSPRVLADRGTVIVRRYRIPVRKVMPWQEDTSQKVLGSNPSSCKGFFQIFICTLHELYNVLILVINTYIHACGRCTHKIKITLSKCFILAKNINCQNILFKFYIFLLLNR